ncbi:glycosyltransferase family 2 protein [Gracilimonas sediminicola]|uniref:glycosyltransferase family 2 protein n=1 Tax=Gracilimonas sediminicola TaxID=2952158 RepID=UPI0038D460B5
MISFIVVGKNEGWKLTSCFNSIIKAIKITAVEGEIIYIDSQSSDDSLDRALEFPEVKIFELTGDCNSAIARNIGASLASGDILFFVDGDMEIDSEFLKLALHDGELVYDCLTGHIDDYMYNLKDQLLVIESRTYNYNLPQKNEFLNVTGGVFLIKKDVWNLLGGMNCKFRRGQDIEFFVRLSKANYELIRLPHLIVRHHTIDYRFEGRMWKNLSQGYYKFPALLFRNHFFTPIVISRTFRFEYTSLILFAVLISFLVLPQFWLITLIIYLLITTIRVFKNTIDTSTQKVKAIYFIERLFYQVLWDFSFIISFFIYYPQDSQVSYEKVK